MEICRRQRPHRGPRGVATGLSFAEVGLHQCPSEKQGQTASGRSRLVLSHVPKQDRTGATAAILADSVRGTLLRRTRWRREKDSNPRSPVGETDI